MGQIDNFRVILIIGFQGINNCYDKSLVGISQLGKLNFIMSVYLGHLCSVVIFLNRVDIIQNTVLSEILLTDTEQYLLVLSSLLKYIANAKFC